MRRSLSFRLFAAFFAPWFAVVVAEPVPMHDCPMHSVHPATAHDMASSRATPAAEFMAPPMPHSGMQESNTEHGQSTPGHAAHHQCCCMGACCATGLAPVARVQQLAWVPAKLRSETVPSSAESFAPTAAPHALPFANGPPAARV
jgi:hypothetical protein